MRFFGICHKLPKSALFPVFPVFTTSENPIVGSRPCVIDILDLTEKGRSSFLRRRVCLSIHKEKLQRVSILSSLMGKYEEKEILHFFVEAETIKDFLKIRLSVKIS